MRVFDLSPRAFPRVAGLAILTLALPGCGNAPTGPPSSRASAAARAQVTDAGGPAASAEASFYPLAVGNRWSYDHALSFYIVPTGGPPGPVSGIRDRRDRDLICVEQINGKSYVVERESFGSAPDWWIRYRQDASGLFEADVTVAQPPACSPANGGRTPAAEAKSAWEGDQAWASLARSLGDSPRRAAYEAAWNRLRERALNLRRALAEAGAARVAAADGVPPGEITRLAYPLRPGAHWVIRDDPRFESTVEGNELLSLAVGRLPAWRVRIDSEFLGPSDHAHFWYGRAGFLKMVAHLEGEATDDQGNPIGVVIFDETEDLVDIALDGGRFTVR